MLVLSTIAELAANLPELLSAGKTLGLVPTMGALHAGHVSLVRRARQECDLVAATVFVNPTQFGPQEDLSRYPRSLSSDLEQLQQAGTNLVFTPTDAEMYPPESSTRIEVGAIGQTLEGEFRPGHFSGVATIVLKLFHLIPADRAYFGTKDFQQLLVIERMVADLNVPITICRCPTVRDTDGVALSSRNAYLLPAEREQARALYQSLQLVRRMVAGGEHSAAVLLAEQRRVLADAGLSQFDYLALVNPTTLQPVEVVTRPTLAALAVRVGKTRLIDNEMLIPPSQ
jgi:pantoate--beta-alanine ligase